MRTETFPAIGLTRGGLRFNKPVTLSQTEVITGARCRKLAARDLSLTRPGIRDPKSLPAPFQFLDLPSEAWNAPTRFLIGCAGRNMKFLIPHLTDDVCLLVIPTEFPRRSSVQKAHLSAGIVEKAGPLHIYYFFGRIPGPRCDGGAKGSLWRCQR